MDGNQRAPEIRGLRITPNVYTTPAELDRLVAALKGGRSLVRDSRMAHSPPDVGSHPMPISAALIVTLPMAGLDAGLPHQKFKAPDRSSAAAELVNNRRSKEVWRGRVPKPLF